MNLGQCTDHYKAIDARAKPLPAERPGFTPKRLATTPFLVKELSHSKIHFDKNYPLTRMHPHRRVVGGLPAAIVPGKGERNYPMNSQFFPWA